MIALLIVGSIIGYGALAGASAAFFTRHGRDHWGYKRGGDGEFGMAVCGVFWPACGPIVLAVMATQSVMDRKDRPKLPRATARPLLKTTTLNVCRRGHVIEEPGSTWCYKCEKES